MSEDATVKILRDEWAKMGMELDAARGDPDEFVQRLRSDLADGSAARDVVIVEAADWYLRAVSFDARLVSLFMERFTAAEKRGLAQAEAWETALAEAAAELGQSVEKLREILGRKTRSTRRRQAITRRFKGGE